MTRDITPTLHKWEGYYFLKFKISTHAYNRDALFTMNVRRQMQKLYANHNHTWSSTYEKTILGFCLSTKTNRIAIT
jgi:hypothetical protein